MNGQQMASPMERIQAVDLLRGLIMALMALDHTRDFFFGFVPSPTDLEATTPALFATRWITHLCAPGFLLLAGVSAALQRDQKPVMRLALFLATRGAFLVGLELTIVSFGWIPDPTRSLVLLQVIWAIGWSMILLAPLVFLPPVWVAGIGLLFAFGHPLLTEVLAALGVADWLRALLIDANTSLNWGGTTYLVSYPILPWFGVMAAGYGLGRVIRAHPAEWPRIALGLGVPLVLAFLVLRWSGLGLDPMPWTTGPGGVWSVMAFLNCEKYPPSPLFLMMTLGPVLILLWVFARSGAGRLTTALDALGRAPLFFYVLHLYGLRIAGLMAAGLVWGFANLGPPPQPSAPDWPLWSVWVIWAFAMILFLPPTRWFADLKGRSGRWWLSYL